MTARSVYWQDGMFMWPHHMQQEERFDFERNRLSHRWNVHHNWGLRKLELDTDAFKNGRLQIRELQARLPDGSLIDVPAEGRLPTLNLNEILLAKEQVVVYLAIAKLHPNRVNAVPRVAGLPVPGAAAAGDTRFLIEDLEVEDENSGEDRQTIQFRAFNLRLLPDTEDLAGYEILPIGRFLRGAANGLPELDINYIPPLLACDAWKPLAVDKIGRAHV
jgi:type VI secretion system protein ImpJ